MAATTPSRRRRQRFIDTGSGSDAATGDLGADTFIYKCGNGADTITDFRQVDGDRIDLTGVSSVHSFAELQAKITQSSPNTVINFGSGDTLVLTGVTAGSLVASNFLFAETLTAINGDGNNNTLTGTAANEFFQGLGGNDIINARRQRQAGRRHRQRHAERRRRQ